MINFKNCLTDEQALPYQNRFVEQVTKSSSQHPLLGKVIVWKGALKDEFFQLIFAGGIVCVQIAEREMQLADNQVDYAESQAMLDTAELIKGSTEEVKTELQINYRDVIAPREQAELTFADLMFLLKWEYVEGAKVDEADYFGE